MTPELLRDVGRVMKTLKIQSEELESMISRTPTSLSRDKLTEANIHVLEAMRKLEESAR